VASTAAGNDPDAAQAGVPTLLYLVGRLDRVVRRGIQDAVKEYGLSVNEYATLSVLARRHGLSNAQLARRSLVSPQSANEVLLALERKGLVVRRAHPAHGRILQSRLTAKGRRVLATCDERVGDVEVRMVAGLTRTQQQAFRRTLLQCVHALDGGLLSD
jgi:DNA-binding MarR family transcriptional regulator